MMGLRYVWKGFKYLTLGLTTGTSIYYLHKNDWDLKHSGPVRFGRAAIAASIVVADYKTSLNGLDKSSEEYPEIKSEVHVRSALRLKEMCCENGGCFIKVGQHLGSLEYLLPKEYVDTFKVLHSEAPQSPLDEIKRVVTEDLGKEIDELYVSFEEQPIGTASLAQVHKAVLKDGRTVAVKVQHPHVKAHAAVDMATMELLVRLVAWIFPEFQFVWLAEETKKNLPVELDFAHEAKNCERMSHMFKDFRYLKVPEVHWDMTSERVLTMEFCEGGQVNDIEYIKKHNIDVNEVSQKLGRLYSEMIFVHGFVHCDPHPGNVLVNKVKNNVQIVLLDHGLYQTLQDDFRLKYCKLWKSIIDHNMKGIKKYAQQLGTGELFPLFACMLTARSWESLNKGITQEGVTNEEDDEIRDSVANYLPQISDVLNRIPRQMLLIFKTNDLLRGIESNLNTRANASSFIIMSKCCVHALYENKRRQCNTRLGRLRLLFQEYWKVFQIACYEFYLLLTGRENTVPKEKVKRKLKDKASKIVKKQKDKVNKMKEKTNDVLKKKKEKLHKQSESKTSS